MFLQLQIYFINSKYVIILIANNSKEATTSKGTVYVLFDILWRPGEVFKHFFFFSETKRTLVMSKKKGRKMETCQSSHPT